MTRMAGVTWAKAWFTKRMVLFSQCLSDSPHTCESRSSVATPPACYRSLSARSVPGVSLGVSLRPFAPRAPQCPKSVPRVSQECQKGVLDNVGTLSGHFLDTAEPGARRAPETPRGTLPGHSGTLRARSLRDSCSRPGGLQIFSAPQRTLRKSGSVREP